jgi:hypothetical protein
MGCGCTCGLSHGLRVGLRWSVSVHRLCVGGGTVPAAVNEAYRRLAEYLASTDDAPAGASDYSAGLGSGAITESFSRAPTWVARALINSGAADLLRPYRRLA